MQSLLVFVFFFFSSPTGDKSVEWVPFSSREKNLEGDGRVSIRGVLFIIFERLTS